MTFSRIWHEHYNPTVPTEITVPDTDITAALDDTISRFGSRTALNFLGAPITYADLGTQISLAAGMLRDLGVQPGDRVAIALPNCTSHVIAFYAVLRLGAIVVEHNPLYTQQELVHQLNDSGATVAIFWERTAAILGQASTSTSVSTLITVDVARDLPLTKRLLLNLPVKKARDTKAQLKATPPAHAQRWEQLLASATPLPADHPRPASSDLAALQYTGGTTGTPKGAMLTHANLVANSIQGAVWTGADDNPGTETVYGILPFFHAFGLTLCLTYALRIGATVMLFPKFEVNSFLDAQKKHPGTFLPAVPPMLGRIVTAARERNVDLTSFRYAICGAMPLDAQTAAAWEDATGGLAIEGYGMTETSPVALGNPLSDQRKPGHLGLPFPSTDVLIVDQEDGRTPVQLGERGELLISGPQVFSGYWGKPQETEQVLVDIDGRTWIRTGDVVVMDETGSVKVVDRIKEMIITGGFKVFPSQVEECVRQMPEVEDVAVVGVPGGDMGEKVVAAVVLAQGATELDVKAVQGWCEKQLARYALPREVIVVPELPRSQIGKVLRRVVRDNVMGGSAAAG
ncbi:AMP-binding protein [Jonesia denitrificans]|uniref:AMP-dependent synthetase and ligase n=1 Tax=Jonesia denitrificans (strain ATCC 14870 / DSM 20603 / BCRC 15368 / CIP 55.134 / JCM 11481 / NBRC 15587 / NCTC 10816 / Prevot 55134) TaxID=471856 RepID=C7R4C6_JONDD|nr:AMP-binding protein [Jonesia denitrificans]ACV08983.1 AMP-dependent synthetase and ligase [Jonesia denitrificans DSM 20603]SQH21074.1 Long-chain-fatty-acid--CoA ligase [Jonesia denitrificans]